MLSVDLPTVLILHRSLFLFYGYCIIIFLLLDCYWCILFCVNHLVIVILKGAIQMQIINKLCCTWMRSYSCSHEKLQLIRSWAKRDGGMKGRKEEGVRAKDETVLVPALSLWSWKVLSITVKCFTAQPACTRIPKPTHGALRGCIKCLWWTKSVYSDAFLL